MTTQEAKIEFDLIANATDSISRAIELLAWTQEEPNEARRLKQAVLAIAHGVELLLKERLRRVHPVLIWENVDKYPSLSARTVTADIAIRRLENIDGLKFSEPDVELIRSLRDTRNAVEHYRWSTTKREADQIIGHALGFAVAFAKDELGYEFFGYGTHRDGTFNSLIDAHPAFAEAYHKRHQQCEKVTSEVRRFCMHCHVPLGAGACEACSFWGSDGDDVPF